MGDVSFSFPFCRMARFILYCSKPNACRSIRWRSYSLLLTRLQKTQSVARVFFTFISILAGIESVPLIHSLLGPYDTSFGAVSWILWGAILTSVMAIAFNKDRKWVSIMAPLSLILSGIYIYLIADPTGAQPSSIWMVWLLFITFLVKVEHPPVTFYKPLSPGRKVLGWLSMLIFVLCISLNPLSIQ